MEEICKTSIPPFPADVLTFTDYELGAFLLGYFIMVQAHDLNIPIDQIPEEFAELVRANIANLDTESPKVIALEKVLHSAANGEFEKAGRIFRPYLQDGAINIYIQELAQKGAVFSSGRRKGSLKKTTQYLKKLVSKNPNMTAKQLYRIALNEAKDKISPFEYDHVGAGVMYDGEDEVTLESFIKRLSKAKNKN